MRSQPFSAASVESGEFEQVVCATGSAWDREGASAYRPDRAGIKQDGVGGQVNVIDVETALGRAPLDPSSLGRSLVLVDESGGYVPLALADIASAAEVSVEFVTPAAVVGEEAVKTGEFQSVAPRLLERGVRLSCSHTIDLLGDDSVIVRCIWGGAPREARADSVVLGTRRIAEDRPHGELERSLEGRLALHAVGDAVAPRKIEAIMYEAEKRGRSI